MIYFTVAGAVFVCWLVLALFFTPGLAYQVRRRLPVDSPEFLYTLLRTCHAPLHEGNRLAMYRNGEQFYPAMLDAIRGARSSVHLECYIFQPGRMADAFIDAFTERGRAGVDVRIVLDTIGSFALRGAPLRRLRDAGCCVHYYRPLNWWGLARLNNRTHRELLVIDGRIAFLGGAGIADWWSPSDRTIPWRDTMARVEGPVVASVQGVFAENWLECCGEILSGEDLFPPLPGVGSSRAFVVKSSPSDRATVSRVIVQFLIEGAQREVCVNTPYFLPDRALREALCETARRGVTVRVVVPGPKSDQRMVRLASRRKYGELLEAGVRMYEYQGTMMHAKVMIVDGLWAAVGTTNLDNRSFEHNDEVNLMSPDPDVAAVLRNEFERDLLLCREITLDAWRRRTLWERAAGSVLWVLERQQ
jgi:cardiolipin synthase